MARRRGQAGFSLIEALVAILLFSLGVLSLVGLQVSAVQQATQAKLRSEASLLADKLIATMWVTDRTAATLATFNTGGTRYNTWLAEVQAALPGSGANAPTVTVTANGQVTVNVFWKAPSEPASNPVHNFVTITQMK
jgi:type IV pilus assembly protein PilV